MSPTSPVSAWLSGVACRVVCHLADFCVRLASELGSLAITLFDQFMSRLPIPDAPAAEREAIGGLATQITAQAQRALRPPPPGAAPHPDGFGRGRQGGATPPLNQKLTAWWELDFPAFRGEIQKVFRQDIPLKERDAWEAWLAERRGQHEQLTADDRGGWKPT